MSDRVPGPVCRESRPQLVDGGTLCRAASPLPGHAGQESESLEQALAALQSQAGIFAWRFIHDAKARAAYVRRIAEAAAEIRRDVQVGRMSAAEGARLANEARNLIMNEVRAITSAMGRAGAESTKAAGLTLDQALDKSVKKLFPGRSFADLTTAQRRQVFEEVIEASGRSSPKVTARIPKWTRFGRGLAVVTVAISVYNIWEAQNKLRQGVKEGSTLLGGVLGGAAANASAGFLCGPGAPVCVTVLFVVGGLAGALIAQSAADYALDQKEVVSWLGE